MQADVPTLQRPSARTVVVCLLLLVVLTIAGDYWVLQSSQITGTCQVGEAVPPIPAIAALIFLVLANPVLRRVGRALALTDREILLTYGALTLSISFCSLGGLEYLFSFITAQFYFATPENNLQSLHSLVPAWFAPQDALTIIDFYEGSDDGAVPWLQWLTPMGTWLVWYALFFGTTSCLTGLFYRQWNDRERLTFPLTQLAQELVEVNRSRYGAVPFFRDPIMWTGFGVAALFNVTNILNAFNPATPALGQSFNVGGLFTERPWYGLQPLAYRYDLLLFGLGYLMSLEVLFSVWFLHLFFFRLSNVGAVAIGYDLAGFPFHQEQGVGTYVALTAFMAWGARERIRQALRKAFLNDISVDDSQEPMSHRLTVLGGALGLFLLWTFCIKAGMTWWTAGLLLLFALSFAIGYARVRAETGAPMIWLFPYFQAKKAIVYLCGSAPLMPGGDARNLTVLTTFGFLARGYSTSFMSYQVDSVKLGEETRTSLRFVTALSMLAVIVGVVVAYYFHLHAYYLYGNNVLYTVKYPQEFVDIVNWGKAAKPIDVPRSVATGFGFLITSGMIILRAVFLRFPIHPLGYAMACAYGSPLWGPFLTVWLIKRAVLKVGGVRLYRRTVPAFLGLVLGHFFTAGVVWGGLSMTGAETFRRYTVFFG